MELIKTEEDYVRDMQMIVELFLVPIRITGILSKTESDSVFQNISHLIPANQKLLDELREQCSLPIGSQRIGRAFLTFTDVPIQQYSHYASQSQQSSQTLLSLAKSNDRWAKFLNETYLNPKLRDLKLDTYLIKPVQRVCRYPLLLKVRCVASVFAFVCVQLAFECMLMCRCRSYSMPRRWTVSMPVTCASRWRS